MRWILDTDHLSLFERGSLPIARKISLTPSESISTTIITVEEVLRGRLRQVRRARGEEQVQQYRLMLGTFELLKQMRCLPFDARAYGEYQKLLALGLRIGAQDMKIGAIALSLNAILVTRNRKDFEQIPGLRIEDWSVW